VKIQRERGWWEHSLAQIKKNKNKNKKSRGRGAGGSIVWHKLQKKN
jgi:hypothetical protein